MLDSTSLTGDARARPHLQDGLGRELRDLRVSITDRCNFRCTYCMPAALFSDGYSFVEKEHLLTFDEIERICRAGAQLGVTKLRLTGGEPLLRRDVVRLVSGLAAIPGLTDLAMTTNGVLLRRLARELRRAGLRRITISLDSLDEGIFDSIVGKQGFLSEVLHGIESACTADFPDGVRINAVIRRGINETSLYELPKRFRGTGVIVRFIEYMDTGNANDWEPTAVVPASEMVQRLSRLWPLVHTAKCRHSDVAERYVFADGQGEIGIISSISHPFCASCTRARLSADGQLFTCLFGSKGTDLKALIRKGSDDEELKQAISSTWLSRADRYSELRVEHRKRSQHRKIEMHYIGG